VRKSKLFLIKRDSIKEDYERRIDISLSWVDDDTDVYPGHGEDFQIREWEKQVK